MAKITKSLSLDEELLPDINKIRLCETLSFSAAINYMLRKYMHQQTLIDNQKKAISGLEDTSNLLCAEIEALKQANETLKDNFSTMIKTVIEQMSKEKKE